nr:RNA-directed DNA polymerase, eukaryota, reverse transcriptase zinc-binding domain protein [Tanacetum cinerariifolium]
MAKNLRLLCKWKWRLYTEKEAFWCQLIKEFYGADEDLSSHSNSCGISGTWCDILKAIENIEAVDNSFKILFVLKILSGSNSLFWKDPWCGNGERLMDIYPILIALEVWKDCKINERWSLISGVWAGNGHGVFIHVRASLNRLLTRSNLALRGISLPTTCPFCEEDNKVLDHCIISCPRVLGIWRKVWSCWNLDSPLVFPSFSISNIALGNVRTRGDNRANKILNGVLHCTICSIRNNIISDSFHLIRCSLRDIPIVCFMATNIVKFIICHRVLVGYYYLIPRVLVEPGSRVVWLSRIDLKGSLLFNFWKEQKGFSVWASKLDDNKKVIVSVRDQ